MEDLLSPTHTTITTIQIEEILPPICKFLNLPRELRDAIYKLICLSNENIYPNHSRSQIADHLGLFRTNHQIYSEIIPIFYSQNTFQIRGTPAWKIPEILNLLSSQKRAGFRSSLSPLSPLCLARHHLKRLYFPSHNINIRALRHLFSLLKYFPNLEHLKVVYTDQSGVKDMDVVTVCRLFRDRRPFVRLELWKRIRFAEAEDVSWMLWESPYRVWERVGSGEGLLPGMWRDLRGVLRQARVVEAVQTIPE